MSDDTNEPLEQVLDTRTRKTLSDVRALLVIGVASVVAVFGAGWAAYAQTASVAQAKADEVARPLERRQADLEQQLERHMKDAGDRDRRVQADLHELQLDVRALYRAIQTGAPQPRLEAPVDGGAP